MSVKLQNRLAVNFTFQMIAVIAVISFGFYILTTQQTKEMKKGIFDKAELYSSILGANLDKIIQDNQVAYNDLQLATRRIAETNTNIKELHLISKNKTILASSSLTMNWEGVGEKYRSLLEEVIDKGTAKSIPQKGMGHDEVIHFMPINDTTQAHEPLIGVLQLIIQVSSEQGEVNAAMRGQKTAYFRAEASQISTRLGNQLKDYLSEAERNFGYLDRLIQNMQKDKDITYIQIFSQELGVLITNKGGSSPQFLAQKQSALQAKAIDLNKTVIDEHNSSSDKISVSSPLLLNKQNQQYIGGAIEMGFTLSSIQSSITRQRQNVLLMNIIIAITFCLLIGLFFKRRILSPLQELGSLTNRVKQDNFNDRSKIYAEDEIGQLAKAFNIMMDDLNESKKEIKDWNLKLQERVNEVSRELKEKQEQLLKTEKMASLGMLSSGIAHEINNPLGVILGETQMLLRELKDKKKIKNVKETEELLSSIELQTKRCSHIVKSLLQFTKSRDLQFSATNIEETLENALEFTRGRLASKKIKVIKDYCKNSSAVIADSIQLEQVFINILINAEQSIKKNGKIKIMTRLEQFKNNPCLFISFEDNGIGINEDNLNKIFDPFFSTKETGEGSGLGLSVSYGIIKSHGGDIEVSSKVGEGSTMIIKLPIKGKS